MVLNQDSGSNTQDAAQSRLGGQGSEADVRPAVNTATDGSWEMESGAGELRCAALGPLILATRRL